MVEASRIGGGSRADGDALPATTIAAIDAALAEAMADGLVPGLSLAVTDRERTLLSRTYGLADRETGQPVQPATLFEIGSIGKTFAAVVILQLAEEGRIGLDDPVAHHLPWFEVPPAAGSQDPITLAHLLTHTAGLTAGTDGTPEALVQVWALRDLIPGSPPGTRFHYSNVSYKILGLVVEAIEGAGYAEVVRRRVLEPLGMADSEPAISNAIRDRLAVGYESAHDDRITWSGRPLARATWLETATADGAIASTATDMTAFVRFLVSGGVRPRGRLLAERSVAAMRDAAVLPEGPARYGYGLSIRDVAGRTFIGHGGGMVGYLAAMQYDPAAGIGCVVLQNGPGGAPMTLARRVIELVAPSAEHGTDEASREPVSADLLGRYRCEVGDRSMIELRAVASGEPELVEAGRSVPLEAWDDDLWLVRHQDWDDALLRVERGSSGVVLWHGAERFVPADGPTRPRAELPGRLLAHGGTYRSHNPWCPLFRVVPRDDRLWLIFPVAPDGFSEEQPLVELEDGGFHVGEDQGGPERLRFDLEIDGRSRRAWLSGWPYYRTA